MSEECEARKENTTGFRKDVWDEMDEEADLSRCPQCGHEYFSDDNWGDIDPHAIEYAEHLNHAERRLAAEREAREKVEKERDEAVRLLRAWEKTEGCGCCSDLNTVNTDLDVADTPENDYATATAARNKFLASLAG